MLNKRSKQIRRDTIHLSKKNGGYHYGGCFSTIEILIALYDRVLGPGDKFILSKGHACWPLYVILRERGNKPALEGHPKRNPGQGIHYTTGSLGHGFPASVGMAFANKLYGNERRHFVLMGDGECQEGTTWESLLLAAKLKLDNLIVIVDCNNIQGSDFVKDVLPIDFVLKETADAAGWEVVIVDGHDINAIERALESHKINKPKLVLAQTIKGKGVSYMENAPEWHAKWPNPEHEKLALEELS